MAKKIKIAVWGIIIGVIALLSLQYSWIRRYHQQELARITETASAVLVESLESDLYASDRTRQEYIINNGLLGKLEERWGADYNGKTVSIFVEYPEPKVVERECKSEEEVSNYFNMVACLYHVVGINFERLDSLYSTSLKGRDISIKYILEKFDRSTDEILETTKRNEDSGRYRLSTNPIELGIDDKHAIRARFDSSLIEVLRQSNRIILASILIVLFIAVILAAMLKTLIYQKKLAAMREDYVNALTHEIKNPIIYLKRVLELMDSPKERDRDRIKTAGYKIEHLRLMLEKLLAVSLKDGFALNPEDLNIRDVLEALVSQCREEQPNLKISLKINTDREIIRADKLHMVNSLVNLIDNAVKYSDNLPVVEIKCYETDSHICISVSDQGIGIPAEYHNSIFIKSFRVPESRSLKRYGFGLGLSYVKMVIEAHNGSVSFSSAPGSGSKFVIKLKTV